MKSKGVARFFKVDLERYCIDYKETFQSDNEKIDNDNIEKIYTGIKLPKRATKFSAGYDIFSPIDFKLKKFETIKIPTGLRCRMDENVVLMVYPRSSLGFKFRLMLDNTIGVIDSDYFNSYNQGHIFIKFTNHGDKDFEIKKGMAFAQGIFMNYLLTDDDDVQTCRNGGLGSTDAKND